MKRIQFSLLMLSFLFTTCQKESIDAPEGIKALIVSTEKNCAADCPSFVREYRWKNDIIYLKSCTGPACLCLAFLYHGNGEKIIPAQGYNESDIIKESVYLREVWKCAKSGAEFMLFVTLSKSV